MAVIFGGAEIVFLFLIIALYFIPTIVGAIRRVPDLGSVIIINLFLGWSVIGWIVALAMAARTAPPWHPRPSLYGPPWTHEPSPTAAPEPPTYGEAPASRPQRQAHEHEPLPKVVNPLVLSPAPVERESRREARGPEETSKEIQAARHSYPSRKLVWLLIGATLVAIAIGASALGLLLTRSREPAVSSRRDFPILGETPGQLGAHSPTSAGPVLPATPEMATRRFYDAWLNGNREAAWRVATPVAVRRMFDKFCPAAASCLGGVVQECFPGENETEYFCYIGQHPDYTRFLVLLVRMIGGGYQVGNIVLPGE